MSTTDSITPVEHARLLVAAIQKRDVKTSTRLWELADLSAGNTKLPRNKGDETGRVTLSVWAKEIGWIALGHQETSLRDMVTEARAWPQEERIPKRTFWQHHEARKMHDGNIAKAKAWLLSRSDTANITEEAREGILGTGPVSEAILQLIKARRRVLTVSAKLSKGNVRGTEANFDRLRFEVRRLSEALDYLNRFLADEMEFDMDALDTALNRILSEEEVV